MSDTSHNTSVAFSIYDGDQLVSSETLSQEIIKIGRLATSDVRLEDDKVSRMHAVIEVTAPGEVFIIDLVRDPRDILASRRSWTAIVSVAAPEPTTLIKGLSWRGGSRSAGTITAAAAPSPMADESIKLMGSEIIGALI